MSKDDASEGDKIKDPAFKKKKRWPLLAAIVATILILSGFAYWYMTYVPDLESLMDGSYSDGEKAKFKAKVTEMELVFCHPNESNSVRASDTSSSYPLKI